MIRLAFSGRYPEKMPFGNASCESWVSTRWHWDDLSGRLLAEMDEKVRLYGERYPLDEDFLAALAIMPDASGIAMGFDRVVMLATGARRIADVVWVPVVE